MPMHNHFHTFAVTMPDLLLPILQARLNQVICYKLFGHPGAPHDLSILQLFDLDRLLEQHHTDETSNLILDGRELSLLKNFLQAERVVVSRSKGAITPLISNPDYWGLVGELLLGVIRPTHIVPLSFQTV